jgi:hypothetical protein
VLCGSQSVFNADPEQASYLNADPGPNPGSQTNADSDSAQAFNSQNVKIFPWKYTCNRSKNIPTEVQKAFWMAGNQVYLLILVNFHAPGSGSAFPIRIQVSQSMRIRIHKLWTTTHCIVVRYQGFSSWGSHFVVHHISTVILNYFVFSHLNFYINTLLPYKKFYEKSKKTLFYYSPLSYLSFSFRVLVVKQFFSPVILITIAKYLWNSERKLAFPSCFFVFTSSVLRLWWYSCTKSQ